MKRTSLLHELDELREVAGPVALAIGVFDGVHLGHREVVRAAVEHARQHQGTAVALTFDPHPKALLHPDGAPLRLTSIAHQRVLLAELGVEHLLVCPFTEEFAATSADVFVRRLVRACRPLGCVSVGFGWTFGRGRSGNVHQLMDAGGRDDFAVYGVPAVKLDGRVVSSTWVREAVAAGDLAMTHRLLGRPYSLLGEVVAGRRLGRELGFPTANLQLQQTQFPPTGVYACEARVAGPWMPAVCNLGRRPTVESDGSLTLEAHLLDWQGDLYGSEMEVRLLHHLRGEMKFDGLPALQARIQQDRDEARQWLSQRS
ncbi:MAG: bifunctional riboflavin kinase/FAD synthetase [Verrucomicrobiales bacterium]|nr:bifunctional riboflavin kinase/FAD synthetase [Verrucomicrobiales bacterium]